MPWVLCKMVRGVRTEMVEGEIQMTNTLLRGKGATGEVTIDGDLSVEKTILEYKKDPGNFAESWKAHREKKEPEF